MKKHAPFLAALVAGMLLAGPGRAQVFGQYSPAPPLGVNARLFGAYAGFTKSESELLAQLRLSFYPNVDFGFLGGLSRTSVENRTRTTVKLGADFKALVAPRGATMPFDLSMGGAIGVSSAEDFNLLSVGPQLVLGRRFDTGGASSLALYAGAILLFTRSDVGSVNDTDVSAPLRFGAEFAPGPDFRMLAEFQVAASDEIGDDLKLVVGANFPF